MTSRGAAEITKNENRWPSKPAIEEVDQRRDVVPQPDQPARLDQVLTPDAAELGVVPNQVGQLAALLHEIAPRQAVDLVLKVRGPDELAEDQAGVVETERLIEIRRDQEMPRDRHVLPAFTCP